MLNTLVRPLSGSGQENVPDTGTDGNPVTRIDVVPFSFQLTKLGKLAGARMLDQLPSFAEAVSREVGLDSVYPIRPGGPADPSLLTEKYLFVA